MPKSLKSDDDKDRITFKLPVAIICVILTAFFAFVGWAVTRGLNIGSTVLTTLTRIEAQQKLNDVIHEEFNKRLNDHDEKFKEVDHKFERVWDKIPSLRAATPKETAQINGN